MTAAVEFDAVSVERGGRRIVGPLTVSLVTGKTTVLLGRSGAGKTTTLRLINGLIFPTTGAVRVNGVSPESGDVVRLRRRIGYVIQEVGLFPHLTVSRNVDVVPRLERWEPERRERRIAELLELVGLPPREYAQRLPHELSGGQRQRVGVARALAADPPLLLCDEPFGAVDPVTRAELQDEFAALTARLGKTVVFVTHDVREAVRLADRLLLLEAGSVHFDGSPDVFRTSDDPTVRAFRNVL